MSFLNGTDPGLRQTRTPTTDNFAAGVDFTAGSTTQLTLSADPGTEDNVEITFDGIQQHRNTYSVSGTTVTFDAAIGSGVTNVEATFTTTIPANTPADNSVTLAKMAGGTDGNLITFDTNGDPAYVATGTSGQVLTSNGAGAAPTMQDAAGGWSFVSSSTISTSSEVAFTNMASGYEYEYVFSNIVAASDGTTFKAELGIAGPTYRTSSYLSAVKVINEAGASNSDEQTTYLPLIFVGDGFGTGTNEELFYGRMWLHDPAASGTKTGAIWDIGNYGSTPETDGFHGYGQYTTAEAHTSIRFFAGTGNLNSGVIKQYRRATS